MSDSDGDRMEARAASDEDAYAEPEPAAKKRRVVLEPDSESSDNDSDNDNDNDNKDEDEGAPSADEAASAPVSASGSGSGSGSGSDSDSDSDSDAGSDSSLASNPVDGPMMYNKSYGNIVRGLFKDDAGADALEGADHRTFVANVEHIKKLHPGKFDDEDTRRDLWLHVICNQYARAKGLRSGTKWEDWSKMKHWYVDGVLNRFLATKSKKDRKGKSKSKRRAEAMKWDFEGADTEQLDVRDPNLLLAHEFLEEFELHKNEALGRLFEGMCFAEHKTRKKFEPKMATQMRKRYTTYEFHKDDKAWMKDVLFEAMARVLRPQRSAAGSGTGASARVVPDRRSQSSSSSSSPTRFGLSPPPHPRVSASGHSNRATRCDADQRSFLEEPRFGRGDSGRGDSGRLDSGRGDSGRGGSSGSVLDAGDMGSEAATDADKRIYWGMVLEQDLQLQQRLEMCSRANQEKIMRALERSDLDECANMVRMECGRIFYRRFRHQGRPKRVDNQSYYTERDREDMRAIANTYVRKTIGKYVDMDAPVPDMAEAAESFIGL